MFYENIEAAVTRESEMLFCFLKSWDAWPELRLSLTLPSAASCVRTDNWSRSIHSRPLARDAAEEVARYVFRHCCSILTDGHKVGISHRGGFLTDLSRWVAWAQHTLRPRRPFEAPVGG